MKAQLQNGAMGYPEVRLGTVTGDQGRQVITIKRGQSKQVDTPTGGQNKQVDTRTGGQDYQENSREKSEKAESESFKRVVVVSVVVVVHLAVILPLALYYIPTGRTGVLCYYYNRSSDVGHELWPGSAGMEGLVQAPINANTKVIFIIHGFSESSHRPWIHRLTDALLVDGAEETVVVVVDYWDMLSLIYSHMRQNARLVATLVAAIIDNLVTHNNMKLNQTHLIGFSLGGRISGMVGARITTGQLASITGIDASYPWVPPESDEEFLEASDASLVVNLRTSPVGSHSPPGHIDFYPNGGLTQPGCQDWYTPYLVEQVCNHYRAVALLIEAVRHARDGVFPACGCPDWNTFQDNTCDCHIVNNFGLYPNASALGRFYFTTNSEAPFSRPLA